MRSNLLPSLFERLAVKKRIHVLEICGAQGATIDLFSNFKCRVYVVDLFSEPFITTPEDDADHNKLVSQFRVALALPDECVLDICLFWDLFNYLDGPALRAFIDAIEPHIGDYTKAFSLGVLSSKTRLPNYAYAIQRLDDIRQIPRSATQLPVYHHSQRELNRLLGFLEVDKSRLLSDGRVESILCRRQGERPTNRVFDF